MRQVFQYHVPSGNCLIEFYRRKCRIRTFAIVLSDIVSSTKPYCPRTHSVGKERTPQLRCSSTCYSSVDCAIISSIWRGVTTNGFSWKMLQIPSHQIRVIRFPLFHDNLIENTILRIRHFDIQLFRVHKIIRAALFRRRQSK